MSRTEEFLSRIDALCREFGAEIETVAEFAMFEQSGEHIEVSVGNEPSVEIHSFPR